VTAIADVAGSRAGLVLSKLQIPSARDGMIRRDGLLAQLLQPASPPLISVVGPGGYGKTTLLAQWAAESPSVFAWLTVDQDDNDLGLLVREIDVALAGAGAVAPAGRRQSPRSVSVRPAATRLRALVSSAPAPFVLVVDDVHELTALAARDFLASLLAAIPQGSHLVLAGRTEIQEVVAAARASRELLELDPADLSLNADEARAVLASVSPDVAEEVAESYISLAEGWAAGLYLLGLTRPEPRADAAVASDRSVSEYLWTQHLAALPDEQLEFLVLTSVLDRLCGSLCDAALERTGSAQLLAEIERV
jgi:LuxR family maltose regulon positive regulatory protein